MSDSVNREIEPKTLRADSDVFSNYVKFSEKLGSVFTLYKIFFDLKQGSATPGTRAKSGTPEGLAWHAKRFYAQANFKFLRFNNFSFESMSDFQCCGFKSYSIIGQPSGTRRSFYLKTIKKWHAALKRLPTPDLKQEDLCME